MRFSKRTLNLFFSTIFSCFCCCVFFSPCVFQCLFQPFGWSGDGGDLDLGFTIEELAMRSTTLTRNFRQGRDFEDVEVTNFFNGNVLHGSQLSQLSTVRWLILVDVAIMLPLEVMKHYFPAGKRFPIFHELTHFLDRCIRRRPGDS